LNYHISNVEDSKPKNSIEKIIDKYRSDLDFDKQGITGKLRHTFFKGKKFCLLIAS